ncbi:unnamed protein product [Ceutorhynchus assimilis]|uniref:Uncharacterized protein n=1 Tax=Ceutorhynchus assimilis TaxID=467358 RepID=A0A9N9MM22_9CUCU|nr:unnamed protein product [Ceutorhynchus assimilis]
MDEVDGNCLGKMQESNENMQESNGNNSPLVEAINNNYNETETSQAEAAIGPTDNYYKMDHEYRGLLIIFNQETFNKDTNQAPRTGTDEDVRKIQNCFTALGFVVHPYKDMTLEQIRQHIRKYVLHDYYHKKRDCFAIFVLTHGNKDELWAKDTYYDPAVELWGQFTSDKCPSLAGKPKLFFLQACQGQNFDYGIKLELPRLKQPGYTEFDGHFSYNLPVNADFLIFYATYEGYYAFRNDVTGSPWVTILCQELQKHHKNSDILTILTFVNRRLAIEYSSNNSSESSKDGKKQISYFKSSLIRLLVFGEK